jgi:hypothetical protein
METAGAKEIGELTGGLNSIEKIITKLFCSGNKTKKVIKNLITTVLDSFKTINMIELLHKRESIIGMIMIALGMLLLFCQEMDFKY